MGRKRPNQTAAAAVIVDPADLYGLVATVTDGEDENYGNSWPNRTVVIIGFLGYRGDRKLMMVQLLDSDYYFERFLDDLKDLQHMPGLNLRKYPPYNQPVSMKEEIEAATR